MKTNSNKTTLINSNLSDDQITDNMMMFLKKQSNLMWSGSKISLGDFYSSYQENMAKLGMKAHSLKSFQKGLLDYGYVIEKGGDGKSYVRYDEFEDYIDSILLDSQNEAAKWRVDPEEASFDGFFEEPFESEVVMPPNRLL